MRYQVLKNSVPVALCNTPEEADETYLEHGADEIREIEEDEE